MNPGSPHESRKPDSASCMYAMSRCKVRLHGNAGGTVSIFHFLLGEKTCYIFQDLPRIYGNMIGTMQHDSNKMRQLI